MRFYEALGLGPMLSLDSEDLKKRFYERSREWHPDRFSRRTAEEQQKSLEMTAVLNDAFRTLRDPISRAEYFLEERGLGPSKNPPPELLEEVFELNIALEELRSGDDSTRPELIAAQQRFQNMRLEIDNTLNTLFARFDETGGSTTLGDATIKDIRSALDRRRYISNLLRDVDKELSAVVH